MSVLILSSEQQKKVSTSDVRKGGNFKENRAEALKRNDGVCEYCQQRESTQGDHFESVKSFADKVNQGEMSLEEAQNQANMPDNIVGSCAGKGGCNPVKGAREPSLTGGSGKFVPTDPTERIQEKIRELEER